MIDIRSLRRLADVRYNTFLISLGMVKISTKDEALSAARDLMRFASHPIMREEVERAIADGCWLLTAVEYQQADCLARFLASFNRLAELESERP